MTKHSIKGLLSRFRINAVVLCLYVVLTIVLTYPVAFSESAIPGDGGTDGYWFMWDFWAFKNAIFSHTNPLYTSTIYYPNGVSLAFHTTSFFNAALSLPLQLIGDLPHAYVFVWLLSFILSGYGAFVLMRYLGGSAQVAFVSGLIFMLCPYRFAHGLGHVNLVATEWIPFYTLFFIKAIKEPKRLNAVIAALFLTLAALCEFTYVIFLAVFSVLVLAFLFWKQKQPALRARIMTHAALTFTVFSILISPLVVPMAQELLSGQYMYSPYKDFVGFSADLMAFFTPSSLHPLLGAAVAPLYENLLNGANVAESTVFLGFTGLVLSILAVFLVKRETYFWAAAAVVFVILSLGPLLQVNGIVFIPLPYAIPLIPSSIPIPLPYAALMFTPVFSISRVPSRWDVMVMLCVSVLSGYTLQHFTSRSNSPRFLLTRKNMLCAAVATLVIFEFLSVPYPTQTTAVPAFYERMAADSHDYAVVEVPSLPLAGTDGLWLYYQTTHHKQLVNGRVSRLPPNTTQFIETQPTLRFLFHIQDIQTDTVPINLNELNPSELSQYDIKYVIVHEDYLTQQQATIISELFQNSTGGSTAIYRDGPMVVYATQPET